MNHQEFERLVNDRLTHCKELLCDKGEEYSRDDERLHNFYSAGRVNGESPYRALWGMWAKHIVSIMDMVKDAGNCKFPDDALLDDKISDMINYTLLLEGLLVDGRDVD